MARAGNVSGAVFIPRHPDDCDLCRGDRQVRWCVVRPQTHGAVADVLGPVIRCPLLPTLTDLVGRLPQPRPDGSAA